MKYKVITFLFCFLTVISSAQQNNSQAALYNIGFGGFTGGIGAVINKSKGENTGKVFVKGFYQGALGGSLLFTSKKMVYNFHQKEQTENIWMAKLVHSAGASIIENAASNRNFWEKWHYSFGFNRLEYDMKEEHKFHYKFMPAAFIGTVVSISDGNTFDIKKSIQTLTPIFINGNNNSATTYLNSIVFKDSEQYKESITHETIHVFQYDEFIPINSFFNKSREKWKLKSTLIYNTNRWLYMDAPSSLTLLGAYFANYNNDCYYDNFFEHEANFYSHQYICR